jgi:outer membrane protein TolC
MKISLLYTIVVVLTATYTNAQSKQDSLLEVDQFYNLVKAYHPIAKRATLIASRAEFEVMGAKGAFDPKLASKYNNKRFEDKQYYDTWNSYLHLPTRLNFDLKAGYERNDGAFLNPENNVPNSGLYYAGVSVPLGQGLLVNTRNIDLKKSRIMGMNLENEAKIVLNNLLLDANHTYWLWYEAYEKNRLVRANLSFITIRYEGIRQAALNGEVAAIDSTEALIQAQLWTNNQKKANLEYVNSQLFLQNFVWSDSLNIRDVSPLMVANNAVSPLINYQELAVYHPEIETIRLKNSILVLDRKLSVEQLKPIIDLNYNFLLSEQNKASEHAFLSNNYKAGVDLSFPLFLRKERAKLKSVNIKQQENDLRLIQKQREITNKVNQAYNKCLTLRDMIAEQQRMISNYIILLEGERTKFSNGESSIFLINSRENKRIAAEIKLIELQAEYGKSLGKLKWSTGTFGQDLDLIN